MRRVWVAAIVVLYISGTAGAQETGETATARELKGMLRQFLVDAGSGNRPGFERFFADDVIYTRATGVVVTKADILKNVESMKPSAEKKTTYSAEDILVREHGETAVVAFRLVARTEEKAGKTGTDLYRNTGVFLRRKGRWQVIAWQATKIAEPPKSNP